MSMQKQRIIQRAINRFSFKYPDLSSTLLNAIAKAEKNITLEERDKKIIALCLFGYSMVEGPMSFSIIEVLANDFGVLVEFTDYAKDWISYAKREKK